MRRELVILGLLAAAMLLLGVFASFVLDFSYFPTNELVLGSAAAGLPLNGKSAVHVKLHSVVR